LSGADLSQSDLELGDHFATLRICAERRRLKAVPVAAAGGGRAGQMRSGFHLSAGPPAGRRARPE
jgi:hypothetical protein